MSENFLAWTAGGLAWLLLVLLMVRTMLAEVDAGHGGARTRVVRRSRTVVLLDMVAVVLAVVVVLALLGRMIVALTG